MIFADAVMEMTTNLRIMRRFCQESLASSALSLHPMRFIPACLAALLAAYLPVAFAEQAEYEDTSVRFQSTYIMQQKPAFRAAYSGTNSLVPEREKSYTWTTTGYFGFRPWQGGEVYLNPEITLGVPFSGLTGVGGFTNGEITRTGGPNPKLYRQRLFMRQTWNQGGGSEQVEADINQMAGSVDKNRVVLTAGNFSTLDVFDNNAYAKDPRTQFMNWSNMTYAAYDYAADARGFGWGFALEWYRDDWVLRIGRMTGPEQPNMLPVDFALGHHYGDQVEVEKSYSLGGQPGKARLLFWRNRANVASFKDALAYLRANPGADPQTILQVRNGEKIKYGLGLNLEQAINDDLGAFLRLMQADGRTETYAFTEVDGSVAAGLSLKGSQWGRGEDTVGLALMANTLSSDRRRYLEAGGISFFIGDGALNYAPEKIFEAYYSLALGKKSFATLDLQRMSNPAYNADRGPVRFVSVRLHTEF